MKFNCKGNLFATVSEKGTLIHIYNTDKGDLKKELKRGIESTVIYSLDFDYFDQWIACIAKTGTIHLWALLDEKKQKQTTGVMKIISFFSSSKESHFTSLKTNLTKHPLLAFDKDSNIKIFTMKGEYNLF